MSTQVVTIAHLYHDEMNIYGDNGNARVLAWRLRRYGFEPKLVRVGVGESVPKQTDILLAGGGQDSGQSLVQSDLQKKGAELRRMVDDGMVVLTICGTYQLLGHYFKTHEGEGIAGIGVFDAVTEAGPERLIGNVVVSTPFGRLVGFENHSGRTFLAESQLPLGKVIKGFGNDNKSGKEGAVVKNAFGSYLHGPVLPKNPHFADELIRRALDRRFGGKVTLPELDDSLALKAAEITAKRP